MPAAALAPAAVAPAFATPPTIEVAADVRSAAVSTVPTAHETNPCAVSRKYTSSVCTLTHLVRSRPARYPPIAEEIRWTAIIHTIAATPTVFADAPSFAHGEIAERPRPAPSKSRMSASAAATNAPAATAPHETPDACASWRTESAVTTWRAGEAGADASIANLLAKCSWKRRHEFWSDERRRSVRRRTQPRANHIVLRGRACLCAPAKTAGGFDRSPTHRWQRSATGYESYPIGPPPSA